MSTNDRIERDVYIAADAAHVWKVLTQAHDIGTWFGNGDPAEIDLRPGGRITFDHDDAQLPAVIVQVEEPKLLSFRWAADEGAGHEPTETNATLVEFTLTPEGEGTRLRVVESGFARVEVEPAVVERRYKANAGGWGQAVRGLAAYVEKPQSDILEEMESI